MRFYSGLPDFFERIRRRVADDPLYRQHDIRLEHYVVSNGLRQMILGSAIAPFVENVWACEFIDTPHPPGYLRGEQRALFPTEEPQSEPVRWARPAGEITEVGYLIDNTSKTRAIFEINKGSNNYPLEIDVNAAMAPRDRRVPFERMIYVAVASADPEPPEQAAEELAAPAPGRRRRSPRKPVAASPTSCAQERDQGCPAAARGPSGENVAARAADAGPRRIVRRRRGRYGAWPGRAYAALAPRRVTGPGPGASDEAPKPRRSSGSGLTSVGSGTAIPRR